MMLSQKICPGCGLSMPVRESASYDGYFNTSPECWSVFTEVLAAEFENAFLFGRVHQLTVDSYAVQHAGGHHPDKSVFVHLAGLHLALECKVRPTQIPPLLQRLAAQVEVWPHLSVPQERGAITVFDVALAGSIQEHLDTVRQWATSVWNAWKEHHSQIEGVVSECRGFTAHG